MGIQPSPTMNPALLTCMLAIYLRHLYYRNSMYAVFLNLRVLLERGANFYFFTYLLDVIFGGAHHVWELDPSQLQSARKVSQQLSNEFSN